MAAKQVLRWGFGALFGAAYLWLGHQAAIANDPPLISLLIGLAPLSTSAVVLAWHSRSVWLQSLCAACLLGMLLNLDFLRSNTAWVYYIQHAGMHTMLGIMFGRTLGKDDATALCARLSSMVYAPPLDAHHLRYARNVTVVWTLYFAGAMVISSLLFFFGPLTLWSVFANLLTPVLIGAIFVVEYLTRRAALPGLKHVSIAHSIRLYREYSERSNKD
ncbi:hypothetical protein GCM10027046_29110 [Uliginosibacterium flavum]|uniref:Transmembrane protein n=1 Tax=Uliginosibacterium flavum TaxID=1396831 RepID=A0ABV2TGM1_9RHOO